MKKCHRLIEYKGVYDIHDSKKNRNVHFMDPSTRYPPVNIKTLGREGRLIVAGDTFSEKY